jgi:hypothetical protein
MRRTLVVSIVLMGCSCILPPVAAPDGGEGGSMGGGSGASGGGSATDGGGAGGGGASMGGGDATGGGSAMGGGTAAVGGGSATGGGSAATGGGTAAMGGGTAAMGGGTAPRGGGTATGGGTASGGGTATGGGGTATGGGSASDSGITVTVSPSGVGLIPNGTRAFTAIVAGSTNSSVTWSIREGADGGTIQNGPPFDGQYQAPATLGTYHVVATSLADPTASGSATVQVSNPYPAVSGYINYSGTKNGRIYASLGKGLGGTSIADPGSFVMPPSFVIRGVSAIGSVTLTVWMDTLGIGTYVPALDPAWTGSFMLTGSSVGGIAVTLTDPPPATPVMGSINALVSVDQGLVFNFNPAFEATAYEVYVSTTQNPSSTNNFQKLTIPAGSTTIVPINNLTNGTRYYVAFSTMNGTTRGPTSAMISAVAGAPTGAATLTGTVAWPAGVTGNLYVGVYANNGTAFATRIPNPGSNPKGFSLSGVPNGTYNLFASFDVGADGILGPTDPTTIGTLDQVISVIGADISGLNIVIPNADTIRQVRTNHAYSGGTDSYDLQFAVTSDTRLPVAATITTGPHVSTPIDLGVQCIGDCGGQLTLDSVVHLGAVRPSAGDTYTVDVTYDDLSQRTLTLSVTGVIDWLATLNAPVGDAGTTMPNFAWTPPANVPQNLMQELRLYLWNGPDVWHPKGLPLTQSSATWNFDTSAQQTMLNVGVLYGWDIVFHDAADNYARSTASFTVH